MDVFSINNEKYITKCPICSDSIKFKIDYDNFCFSVECINGHNKKNISFEKFSENFIRPSQIFKSRCYNCYNNLNDNSINYKCQICNILFCKKCINKHNRKENHDSKIEFIHNYLLCQKHNKRYTFFCETCKKNICNECQILHKKHSLKSFFDIIPSTKTKNSAKKKMTDFKKKVDEMISLINKHKNEIIYRFNKINKFFKFLIQLNDALISNFNSNYFEYYNFENYNYLLQSLSNKNIFDFSRYINYLTMKEKKEFHNLNEGPNYSIKSNNKTNDYIKKCNNIKYLKDNIFFTLEKKILKFFEFKDFSFNLILSYNLGRFNIYEIEPAKYSNTIFLHLNFSKEIKFIEYYLLKKRIIIPKKVIQGSIRNNKDYHFKKYFEIKNRKVITYDDIEICAWEKIKKQDIYKKELILESESGTLIDINNDLFCFQDKDFNIKFYDTESFQCNKSIIYNKSVSFIGIINNNALVFKSNNYFNSDKMIIIDLKFLEIVQIFEDKYIGYPKIIKNNLLYNFSYNNNKITIIKMIFNEKEKCFNVEKEYFKKIKIDYFLEIISTDIGYIIILDNKNIIFNYLD